MAFVVVNALIFLLWYRINPQAHPWFLYPLGWTIGLASHYMAWFIKRRHRREQRSRLTREQRRTLKKIQQGEKGWAAHLTAYVTTTAYSLMFPAILDVDLVWFP